MTADHQSQPPARAGGEAAEQKTAALIAEAEALCAAATQGPWTVRQQEGLGGFVQAPRVSPTDPYDIEVLGEDETGYPTRSADMEFVARARTLIPELVDALAASNTTGGRGAAGIEQFEQAVEQFERAIEEHEDAVDDAFLREGAPTDDSDHAARQELTLANLLAARQALLELFQRGAAGGETMTETELWQHLEAEVERGRGDVQFGYTENGNVGVFRDGFENPLGVGDTCAEAWERAIAALPVTVTKRLGTKQETATATTDTARLDAMERNKWDLVAPMDVPEFPHPTPWMIIGGEPRDDARISEAATARAAIDAAMNAASLNPVPEGDEGK